MIEILGGPGDRRRYVVGIPDRTAAISAIVVELGHETHIMSVTHVPQAALEVAKVAPERSLPCNLQARRRAQVTPVAPRAASEIRQMKLTPERFMLGVVVALLIWCGAAVIKLEGYRYAVSLGMCHEHHPDLVKLDECLRRAETRNPLWHLLYGLGVL